MKSHIESLIHQLEVPDAAAGLEAAEALGRIGPQAVGPLLSELHHEQWYVRLRAARALGEIGDLRAVDGLLSLLNDPADPTIATAVKALGKIGYARILPDLINLYRDAVTDRRYSIQGAAEVAVWGEGERGEPVGLLSGAERNWW